MNRRWLALLMVGLLPACTAQSSAEEQLMVFAAASLTDAMDDLIQAFERQHSGSDVTVNLAGSNQLALQIEQGAPAHVYISANPHWMRYLTERDLVTDPAPIASNDLVIATPARNPGDISSWKDLARQGLLVVTAAPEVPAGRYTDSTISRLGQRSDAPPDFAAGVMRNVVSREESVKGVVAKLLLGEADAGFVYRTDASAASGLRTVSLPGRIGITENYLIAVVALNTSETARAFADFVQSDAGRRILNEWGFYGPNEGGS